MRQCSKCKQEKLLTDFYKRGSQCKVCHKSLVYAYKKTEVGKQSTKKYHTKKIGVYGIFENDLCLYVGQSTWLNCRINSHKSYIKNPEVSPKREIERYKLISKHNNIFISVLEECSRELLIEREHYYIDTYKPLYNTYK
jgi:hypothetical protein